MLGIVAGVSEEERVDAGEANASKGRKSNTFRNHAAVRKRPLQAGHGSLGIGDGGDGFNGKRDKEHPFCLDAGYI